MTIFITHIEQLEKFSEQEKISDIIIDLFIVNTLPAAAITPAVERLRTQLTPLLAKKDIKKDGISLADVAFETLLALARYRPVNTDDPISLEPISFEDSVVISTGQQFSLTTLIQYHITRAARRGETAESKRLLNPLTNTRFETADEEHIIAVATERGIDIPNLRAAESIVPLAFLNAELNAALHSAMFFNFYDRENISPFLDLFLTSSAHLNIVTIYDDFVRNNSRGNSFAFFPPPSQTRTPTAGIEDTQIFSTRTP